VQHTNETRSNNEILKHPYQACFCAQACEQAYQTFKAIAPPAMCWTKSPANSADKCNARWNLGLLKESKFGNRALSVLQYLFMYFSYSAAHCGDVVHLEAMMIAGQVHCIPDYGL